MNVNHLALDTISNTTFQQICKKTKPTDIKGSKLHTRSAGTSKRDHCPKQK